MTSKQWLEALNKNNVDLPRDVAITMLERLALHEAIAQSASVVFENFGDYVDENKLSDLWKALVKAGTVEDIK